MGFGIFLPFFCLWLKNYLSFDQGLGRSKGVANGIELWDKVIYFIFFVVVRKVFGVYEDREEDCII